MSLVGENTFPSLSSTEATSSVFASYPAMSGQAQRKSFLSFPGLTMSPESGDAEVTRERHWECHQAWPRLFHA